MLQLFKLVLVGALASLTLSANDLSDGLTKGISHAISTGVSLNQQIASSSLNNTASAVANGGQFVITKSGRYFLSTDVIANPVASAPIIYINCSDVVLDLGGKTLTITGSTSLKYCTGVRVAPGMKNIAICNGVISGSSTMVRNRLRTGISVVGLSDVHNANIIIDNVDITGCAYRGVEFIYCDSIEIADCCIQGTRGCACVPESKSGLFMQNCSDGLINESIFNYTEVVYPDSLLTGYGVYLESCNNLQFKNVSASNNRGSHKTECASGVGIYLNKTTSCTFQNVRCVANQMAGGVPRQCATRQPTAGFLLDELSVSNIFTECIASDNTTMDLSQTCSAYGFRLTCSSGKNVFLKCIASNNYGVTGEGFSSTSGSGNNNYKECIADGNSAIARVSWATAAGFRAEFSKGNVYLKCTASGNSVSDVCRQSAHGIVLRSEHSSMIRESLFSANMSTGYGAAYGIRLAGNCKLCVVGFNEMISNEGFEQYGYKDDSASTTTMLRGNLAFGHGPCYAGGTSELLNTNRTNYSFWFAETPGVMNVQNMVKEADIANMNAFEAGSVLWYNFSVLSTAISG